jgi:death-on-curing protein
VTEPFFVGVEEVLHIHRREIDQAGGDPGVRDLSALEAAVLAPQVTHGGQYLLDLFDMAAAYLVSISVRHPFVDGNKRAAAATALTFLYVNGWDVEERHPEELADMVFALLRHELDREGVGNWFRERSNPRG